MQIEELNLCGQSIAEVVGAPGSLRGPDAVKSLIGDVAGRNGPHRVLAARELIDESFFDLKTGFAEELAKQVSDSGVRLAVHGGFSLVEILALKAFLLKSGLSKAVRFFPGRDAALKWLAEA